MIRTKEQAKQFSQEFLKKNKKSLKLHARTLYYFAILLLVAWVFALMLMPQEADGIDNPVVWVPVVKTAEPVNPVKPVVKPVVIKKPPVAKDTTYQVKAAGEGKSSPTAPTGDKAGVVSPTKDVHSIKSLAQAIFTKAFGADQWPYMHRVIMGEGAYRPHAQNPNSTAYGICQFLDGTWKGTGYRKTSDPETQLKACVVYVRNRYHTPRLAWQHKVKNGWY